MMLTARPKIGYGCALLATLDSARRDPLPRQRRGIPNDSSAQRARPVVPPRASGLNRRRQRHGEHQPVRNLQAATRWDRVPDLADAVGPSLFLAWSRRPSRTQHEYRPGHSPALPHREIAIHRHVALPAGQETIGA